MKKEAKEVLEETLLPLSKVAKENYAEVLAIGDLLSALFGNLSLCAFNDFCN